MADRLKSLEDRLVAILESGYGTRRTIPPGWFQRSSDRMSLRDPSYPRQVFDGAYEIRYVGTEDHPPGPSNPYDPAWLRDVTFTLTLGFLEGAGAAGGWNPGAAGSGETAAFSMQNASHRALDRAECVWRALNWPDNVRDTTSDPKIVEVRRLGRSEPEDLGDGRLLIVTTYVAWLQLDPENDYPPDQ